MSANFQLATEPAMTFKFGEFIFDCGSHVLRRGNTERHLSPKAQKLLQLLLLARPRALSREELYDALWPSTFVCETNMASIVNQLRRALGDDARAAQYIRTVHGFGYAFCGEVAVSTPSSFASAVLSCEGLKHLLFEGENVVGRAIDSRVVLADRSVSRRHAIITVVDGSVSIKDLQSTNGTYVDGERIRCAQVANGARIWFGTVEASINSSRISTTHSLELNMQDLQRQVAERMANA